MLSSEGDTRIKKAGVMPAFSNPGKSWMDRDQ
jgi:hypothetical protein